jgi:hypothetical protein
MTGPKWGNTTKLLVGLALFAMILVVHSIPANCRADPVCTGAGISVLPIGEVA